MALLRCAPSRSTSRVRGSVKRASAPASSRGSRGSTISPLTPSRTTVPAAPVMGDNTTGTPTESASTTTRPTRS
jgi:hypothetical protein